MPRILFGPFEPDKPPHLSQGLQIATNVYPGANGYRPVPQLIAITNALPGTPLGAASFVSEAGNASIIAGTASTLYRSLPTGWELLSTGYSMTGDARWRFAQFGALAIATNGTDPMVKINLDTFSAASLGGSPPTTKMLAVVKDFLVGGVIDGQVNKIQWSAINNAEFWTVGENQSDFQIMPSGGEVTGILGGEIGIILQRGRVSRMTYEGGNLIFRFDEISYNIGCVSRHSVAQSGILGFFLSDNGFMMWDGAALRPIGQERVDRTFSASYSRADWANISTAIDVLNCLVIWSMGDRMFVYNWVLDRWSIIEAAAEIVFSGFTRDMTLEELSILYGSLEAVPYPLDDDRFKGGNPRFYVFGEDNKLAAFTGFPMEAVLGLGDIELAPGREARINEIRPLADAAAGITLTAGGRARLGDVLPQIEYDFLTDSGVMPVRESGRYMRLTQTIAAGIEWTYSQGLDVPVAAGGRR